MKEGLALKGSIIAVFTKPDGSKRVVETSNIITTAGFRWVVQKLAGEAVTNNFNALHLGTGTGPVAQADDADDVTDISGSGQAVAASYPMTDDPDADNTGAGPNVLTWKFTYAQAAGPWNNIAEGAIAAGTGALGAAQPIFNHFLFASAFNKTTDESLVVYINVERA